MCKPRGKKIQRKCKNCSTEFEALAIKVRQGKGLFCSKKCYNKYRASNKLNEKEANIFYQKKHKYGLSKEEYQQMFIDQDNKCKICSISFDDTKACVDHDHSTGEVRGLLCDSCNRGLGYFKDNIDSLKNAINYLVP